MSYDFLLSKNSKSTLLQQNIAIATSAKAFGDDEIAKNFETKSKYLASDLFDDFSIETAQGFAMLAYYFWGHDKGLSQHYREIAISICKRLLTTEVQDKKSKKKGVTKSDILLVYFVALSATDSNPCKPNPYFGINFVSTNQITSNSSKNEIHSHSLVHSIPKMIYKLYVMNEIIQQIHNADLTVRRGAISIEQANDFLSQIEGFDKFGPSPEYDNFNAISSPMNYTLTAAIYYASNQIQKSKEWCLKTLNQYLEHETKLIFIPPFLIITIQVLFILCYDLEFYDQANKIIEIQKKISRVHSKIDVFLLGNIKLMESINHRSPQNTSHYKRNTLFSETNNHQFSPTHSSNCFNLNTVTQSSDCQSESNGFTPVQMPSNVQPQMLFPPLFQTPQFYNPTSNIIFNQTIEMPSQFSSRSMFDFQNNSPNTQFPVNSNSTPQNRNNNYNYNVNINEINNNMNNNNYCNEINNSTNNYNNFHDNQFNVQSHFPFQTQNVKPHLNSTLYSHSQQDNSHLDRFTVDTQPEYFLSQKKTTNNSPKYRTQLPNSSPQIKMDPQLNQSQAANFTQYKNYNNFRNNEPFLPFVNPAPISLPSRINSDQIHSFNSNIHPDANIISNINPSINLPPSKHETHFFPPQSAQVNNSTVYGFENLADDLYANNFDKEFLRSTEETQNQNQNGVQNETFQGTYDKLEPQTPDYLNFFLV